MTNDPIKYCPFCGNQDIKYADEEIRCYAWCGNCKTWISAARDFEQHEVIYIVQKLKSIRKMAAMMKEAME